MLVSVFAIYTGLDNLFESAILALVVVTSTIDTIWTSFKLYNGFKYDVWEGFRYNNKLDNRIHLTINIGFILLMVSRGDLVGIALAVAVLYHLVGEMFIIKKCKEEE